MGLDLLRDADNSVDSYKNLKNVKFAGPKSNGSVFRLTVISMYYLMYVLGIYENNGNIEIFK